MAAFRLAAELGAQAIETDVQMTADGRLVLIHDKTLQRTTSGRGRVSAKTFDELRRLDAGSWFPKRLLKPRRRGRQFPGERIPSLEELLAFAQERGILVYLEIKTPCASGIEEAVVAAIRKAGWPPGSAVICFDGKVLERLRRLDPRIALGYLCDRHIARAVARATSLGARVILPRANRVGARLLASARENRLQLITWTVNSPRRMKALASLGVDGIMSDFPDRLAAAVGDT